MALGSNDKCGSIAIATVYSDWNCSCGGGRTDGTDCIFCTVWHNQHSRVARYRICSTRARRARCVFTVESAFRGERDRRVFFFHGCRTRDHRAERRLTFHPPRILINRVDVINGHSASYSSNYHGRAVGLAGMELLWRSDIVFTDYHGESKCPDRIGIRGGTIDWHSDIAGSAD
jgi:hypothetical protein